MEQKTNDMKWRNYMWAIFGGLFLTVLPVVMYATKREVDRAYKGGAVSWKDWWTLVGYGMIGQAMQVFVIWLNLNY